MAAADGAVGAVDLDDDLRLFSVVFLGGGDQRRLDPLEDDLFVDILIAVDRVDDAKQFVGVHSISLSPGSEQYLSTPRSTPRNGRDATKSYDTTT